MKKIRFSLFAIFFCSIIYFISGCSTPPENKAPDVSRNTPPPAAHTNAVAPAPDLASNPPPRITALNPALPTIFIAGDSTAARGAGARQQGWAVPFADYFDLTKVNVANRARSGRSSRTFVTEGLWDALLANVKPGDIVLIQFGHNDSGAVNDTSRARGSLPGVGDESQEIDNQLTHKHETVHTFGWYIRKMIADTKAKHATPIVLSLTERDVWNNGRIERGSGHFSQWSSEIARSNRVQFVDVTDWVADEFDAMGQEKVHALYPQDHTHFNAIGADIHAAAVISGLKGLHPDPVQKYLSEKGQAVPIDSLAWLNLPHPVNAKLPTLFLIGDSTVRNGHGDGANNQWGWGDFLGKYFDQTKINVVNRAVGGTSSRTYYTQDHWQRVLSMTRPGDFVMMQFGHNDNGSPTNPPPGRTSIKGTSEETLDVVDPATGKHETIHTFGWYIRKYISDARAKGATPIVCSLIPRKTWKDGKIARAKESHAGWAEAAAKSENAPFVDLNEIIAERYDAMGPEKVDPLFADGHTHTTGPGADLNAQCVVAGLKALNEDPLAAYIRTDKP